MVCLISASGESSGGASSLFPCNSAVPPLCPRTQCPYERHCLDSPICAIDVQSPTVLLQGSLMDDVKFIYRVAKDFVETVDHRK